MTENLNFHINWRKDQITTDTDTKPKDSEQHEIAVESILMAESLIYVLMQAAINTERATDDRFAIFNRVQMLIMEFCASALFNLDDLEKRRKELELKVSQIQTR